MSVLNGLLRRLGFAMGSQDAALTLVNEIRSYTKTDIFTATTAQVNAGLVLLPALPGFRYRLHDMAMIAVGGNAATATSVDILGTQSASAVKLMDGRVAGLTQNTLLRAGTATNGLILAAGASFDLCDANTAISVGATGTLATATSVRVLLTYDVVPV